jgi:hypothetical protein
MLHSEDYLWQGGAEVGERKTLGREAFSLPSLPSLPFREIDNRELLLAKKMTAEAAKKGSFQRKT